MIAARESYRGSDPLSPFAIPSIATLPPRESRANMRAAGRELRRIGASIFAINSALG